MVKHTIKLLLGLVVVNLCIEVFAQERIEYYSADFAEGIPSDMTMYDIDGQSLHYTMIQAGFKQGEAWIGKREKTGDNRHAASACRYKAAEGETLMPSNDWLITPAIWVRADDATLRWRAISVNSNLEEGAGYEVRVSTEGNAPEDFIDLPIHTTAAESVNEWSEYEVALGEYVGKRVYVAFVNNSATGEILGIDDVVVAGSKGLCDLRVTADGYIYGDNELVVKGYLEACSDEIITDVTIRCYTADQEIVSSYDALNLGKGDKLEFELPATLHVDYGQTIDYQVVAEVNGVTTTDPEKCRATALMYKFHKNIVVEEATGMWCTYCPAGIVAMEELGNRYPDTFIGLALHYNDPIAVDDYVMDLSFPDGFPTGWINRKYYTQPMKETQEDGVVKYTMLNGGFETYYLQELATPAVAEVSLASEPVGNTLQVTADVRFAMDVNDADYQLAYVLIENNVEGQGYYQVNGYAGENVEMGGFENLPEVINDIKFQHVVRAIYDDWQGVEGSIPTELKGGEVYTHEYAIELPETIDDVNDVELIAMLIDMKTGAIANADKVNASTDVKTIETDRPVLHCVENAGFVSVSVENVGASELRLALYDVSGRLVELKHTRDSQVAFDTKCDSGVYIVELWLDRRVVAKKLIV